MRKLFTDPTIEIKNFEMENIVTVSGETGTPYEGSTTDLKNDKNYTTAVVDALKVLHFNQ